MIKVKENEHVQVYNKMGGIITMADNLDGLRMKIASLYNERIAPNELGTIALEIILKRNEAKSELENDPTLDKKHEVELRIDDLHEFERVVVSMYMLQGITSPHEKLFNMSDFTRANYQLFNKKISS